MEAAGPTVAGDAAKIEIVARHVQGEAVILIVDAAAARRIAEGILLESLQCRSAAAIETDGEAKPFLGHAGECSDIHGSSGVEDEMKSDRAAVSVGSFPDAGEVFGVGNRLAEIEAAILMRGRRRLRADLADEQR